MAVSRRALITLLGAGIAAPATAQNRLQNTPKNTPKADAGWWTFDPPADTFDPAAKLDLRSLNEPTAGDHGFIRLAVDGESFVRGDGTPIRFWGGTVAADGERTRLDRHARFLAKRGVNMVRWHGNLTPVDRRDSRLSDVNETALDQAFYLVATMKKQGIYCTLSPYWAFFDRVRDDKDGRTQALWPVPRDPQEDNLAGLLFFDPVLIAAYKGWITALFTRTNPYTGVALKDDPALAIFQIQNEDSLLFWTFNNLKGADRDLIEAQYATWRTARYGSATIGSGKVALPNIYDLTQPEPSTPDLVQNHADATEFLTETMRRFNADIIAFIRNDLGAKVLINPGNWRTASMARLNDAERYGYTPGDVLAVNRYVTGRHEGSDTTGWAVKAGDLYTDVSTLTEPDKFPLTVKQVAGHPMMVTESLWVPPTAYESEGPFLISAMQSLNGVAGYYWFSLGDAGQWEQPHSANGFLPSVSKWSANSPMVLGQFPAAALLYRMNLVASATRDAVVEHRTLDDLWHRRMPIISEESGFDPNRDTIMPAKGLQAEQTVLPLAYLAGPVRVVYNSDKPNDIADLSTAIDPARHTVTSFGGALTWNYADGLAQLNAPHAQGVTGFLNKNRGRFQLSDCLILSSNDYASILLVSLDGAPLATSRKVLIQVGTQARPTGWSDQPATWTSDDGATINGHKIVSHGQAPWLIADNHVEIRINNPGLTVATALDANGLEMQKAISRKTDDGLTITIPRNCLYVVAET